MCCIASWHLRKTAGCHVASAAAQQEGLLIASVDGPNLACLVDERRFACAGCSVYLPAVNDTACTGLARASQALGINPSLLGLPCGNTTAAAAAAAAATNAALQSFAAKHEKALGNLGSMQLGHQGLDISASLLSNGECLVDG